MNDQFSRSDCLPAKDGFETTHNTLRAWLEDFLLFF